MQAKIRRRLLIIKPPYRHIPVGMAYVLSCLDKNSIPFDFIDTLRVTPDYSKLLKRNNYLAVAIGGLVANVDFISQTIKKIRSIQLDLPIILGGNIVKDTNPEFLFDREIMGIDYGIIGEVETSLPYLIEKLNNGFEEFKEIPGLVFKDEFSGEIVKNNPIRLNMEKENILPAWNYIDMEFYKYAAASYMSNQIVLPVLTGRGCVGTCTFCSPTVGTFKKRPIKHVMEEIKFLSSKYQFDTLQILNEVFYLTKEDILRFCMEYEKLKIKKPWMCSMRADVRGLDNETFAIMKNAGCILAGFGIESGSNKVLNIMKKRITKEQIVDFCRYARNADLPSFGTFMVGNEGETEGDFSKTIDMVIEEEMNTNASLVDAYPGTQIYKNALNRGLIKNEREYFKNIDFNPHCYDMDFKKKETYLNVSDIPTERFWKVVFTELRRFYTFSYNRFKILNVKVKRNWLTNTVKINGICSECGASVKIVSIFSLLSQMTYCYKCYRCVRLNWYKTKRFSGHFKSLCKGLKRTEKLVIIGVGVHATDMVQYDHFKLDYEKIKGFVDFQKKDDSKQIFAYFPKLQMDDLQNIVPDTVLIADDLHGTAEFKLRRFYLKNKLKFPKILYLHPDRKILMTISLLKSVMKRLFGTTFVKKVNLFFTRNLS